MLTRGGNDMEHYEEQRRVEKSQQHVEAFDLPPVARVLARLGLSETAMLSGTSMEQQVALLQDHRWEMRASAATALGKVGTDVPIGALVVALEDEYEEVRAAVARALGRLGKHVPVSTLLRALQDQSPLVREAAATALGKVGTDVPINPLAVALQDEHEEVRAAVARTLGRLGKHVPVSTLLRALQDQSPLVREAVAEALGVLGNSDARLPLLAVIQDEEALVRDAVAQALMTLEQDVLQKLIEALVQEKEQSVQKIAASAVKVFIDLGLNVHEEVAPIVPLVVALYSMDRGVQKMAMWYLVARAIEVINEKMSIEPLIDILCKGSQERITLEGVWRTFRSLAQGTLRERKIVRLLMAAAKDRDITVQAEVRRAVQWLIELALTLLEEKSSTEHLQAVLQDSRGPAYETTVYYLIGQALEALEEREPIEPLLTKLSA